MTEVPPTTLSSPETHVNPTQLRHDHWARIRDAADSLQSGDASLEDEFRATIEHSLDVLSPWEGYFAFPGPARLDKVRQRLASRDYELLAAETDRLETLLRTLGDRAAVLDDAFDLTLDTDDLIVLANQHKYFTVLVADSLTPRQVNEIRRELHAARGDDDEFFFEIVPQGSFEDAMAAALANPQIQAAWIRGNLALRSENPLGYFRRRTDLIEKLTASTGIHQHGPLLGRALADLRPEIDLYLMIDAEGNLPSPADQALFRRVFYLREHQAEVHMTTIDGVRQRYRTPFFDALKEYARRPIGNFHALPIARGNSVFNSEWISDMGEFYGEHIFLAETSSTSGGLDSLLAPTGTIGQAQEAAARAFGARHTFFATNGTSSSNKIVVQALCRPGDVVLIDRDCHKSHHYGLVMAGAHPIYLDAYPITEYAFYGAVPTRSIKQQLLDLKRAGRLDDVRLVLLTNCTFDGIVYHPLHVMRELLAIKPDLIFLWDEAWFAFARLHPTFRRRSAMFAAARLHEDLNSEEYRKRYANWREEFDRLDPDDDATWLDNALLPDPDTTKVRVYATQSTHKSLSSLRQGSMIHAWDESFASEVEEPFQEAFFTHTTTSPNYQILASLDLARRQVELEGYGKLSNALQMALVIRNRMANDPQLSKYFRFLDPQDMIPEQFRASGVTSMTNLTGFEGLLEVLDSYDTDEFVLDPTRLTLAVGDTGLTGEEFKVDVLMDKFGIQINKTATNTVLFMTNIGTTWSAIDYLLLSLRKVCRDLDEQQQESSPAEQAVFDKKVETLNHKLPPLPDFSSFHEAFRDHPESPEGDIRAAFFLAYDQANVEYVPLDEAIGVIESGRELVATKFIIPYPPGFPVLVPGQVVSPEIVEFMRELAIDEIHGFRPELGIPVFTEAALAGQMSSRHVG